jgi:hypothetical protein
MKSSHLLTLISTSLSPLTACSVAPSSSAPAISAAAPAQANASFPILSAASKRKIGKKIWQNESGGTVSGLTTWNKGEEFPSLGIGHFIWYPKNYRGPYTESFPAFIRYAQQRGAKSIPGWVLKTPSCPWLSRASFNAAKKGAHLTSLRNFLASNVELQTDFILAKSQAALGKILAVAAWNYPAKLRKSSHHRQRCLCANRLRQFQRRRHQSQGTLQRARLGDASSPRKYASSGEWTVSSKRVFCQCQADVRPQDQKF